MNKDLNSPIAKRFRGYLPVVVDIETAGFNAKTDALLEVAMVTVAMDPKTKYLQPDQVLHHHILPFTNANLEPSALEFNGIDPYHPFRFAIPEEVALLDFFTKIYSLLKQSRCYRAILVGHNPNFDLSFINAAIERNNIQNNPFHRFTTFDTATLGGLAFGQTVLARAVKAAKIDFDHAQAHSALYDAKQTAELFCHIVNQYQKFKDLSNTHGF